MGGMSFQCLYCGSWKLTKGGLKDHVRDKHKRKLPIDHDFTPGSQTEDKDQLRPYKPTEGRGDGN